MEEELIENNESDSDDQSFDIQTVISFDALYDSMMKCKSGVLWKDSTAHYYLNGIEETLRLSNELANGTYKPREPRHFTVKHPKEREIISISFRDRVYQRSLNDNVIYPLMTKSFIYDNMACQKGKGTDKARKRLTEHIRDAWREYGTDLYVLQCDIKGYYPSMRHDVVYAMMKQKLPPEVYERAKEILSTQYDGDIGFNPGSQMVQIAGISTLNRLDHIIKEQLHIKAYIRYMDDFILIHYDKAYLQKCLERISAYLSTIGFTLHEKKTRIYHVTKGIPFLGFRFLPTNTGKVLMLLNPDNVKSERKKLTRLVHRAKRGEITREKVDECYRGWRAHASKGNNYHILQRMDEYYRNLWKE